MFPEAVTMRIFGEAKTRQMTAWFNLFASVGRKPTAPMAIGELGCGWIGEESM